MAAAGLGLAASAQEDCLHCDGPTETPQEGFEWEIRILGENGETPGLSGWTTFQATAMDELRTAMRSMERETPIKGIIRHRVYDFGVGGHTWTLREIFRAYVDPAGAVRFDRVGK